MAKLLETYRKKAILFSFNRGDQSRISYLARDMITLFQIPVALITAISAIILNRSRNFVGRTYAIGAIEVQGNILFIRDVVEGDAYTINVRGLPLRRKNQIGTHGDPWGSSYRRRYDIFLASRYFGRIFLAPIIFGYLIASCKKFIYVADAGYLLSANRGAEFLLLKIFNKKIIIFYCGCDARQRQLYSALTSSLGLRPFCRNCEQRCDYQFKRNLAYSDQKFADRIFSSIDQTGFVTNYTSFDSISMPIVNSATLNFVWHDSSVIRILHAANIPALRGSDIIDECLAELVEEGYPIIYRNVSGCTRDDLIEEMGRSHIYISQITGLVLGLAAVEALFRGNVVIVGCSTEHNPDLPKDLPTVQATNKASLRDALIQLITSERSVLRERARLGRSYAMRYHSVEKSGLRFRRYLECT